jgi:hypothetical protein
MPVGAVITADIVNSSSLPSAASRKLWMKFTELLDKHTHEFFRGDSFQVVVKHPAEALRLALLCRCEARKISDKSDLRIAIGIGSIRPRLKKLNTATDEAFVISGRTFDSLEKDGARLAISSPDAKANHGFHVMALFIDYLFRNLTGKQATVMAELLKGHTQKQVAGHLRKSPSTIHKHTLSIGWQELQTVLKEYDGLTELMA